MTLPDHSAVAQAVVDSLNTASESSAFSMEFTACRRHVDTRDRELTGPLEVIVGHTSVEMNPTLSRETSQEDFGVKIVCWGEVKPDDRGNVLQSDVDDLMLLTQQIRRHLRDNRKMSCGYLAAIQQELAFDAARMFEQHQFFSEMTAIYSVFDHA